MQGGGAGNIASVVEANVNLPPPPAFRYPDGYNAPTTPLRIVTTFPVSTGSGGGCAVQIFPYLRAHYSNTVSTNANGVVSWGTAQDATAYAAFLTMYGSYRSLAMTARFTYEGPHGSGLMGSHIKGSASLAEDAWPGSATYMGTMFDDTASDPRTMRNEMGSDVRFGCTAMSELGVEAFVPNDAEHGSNLIHDRQQKGLFFWVRDGPASTVIGRIEVTLYVEAVPLPTTRRLLGGMPAPLNVALLNTVREEISRVNRGGTHVSTPDAPSVWSQIGSYAKSLATRENAKLAADFVGGAMAAYRGHAAPPRIMGGAGGPLIELLN